MTRKSFATSVLTLALSSFASVSASAQAVHCPERSAGEGQRFVHLYAVGFDVRRLRVRPLRQSRLCHTSLLRYWPSNRRVTTSQPATNGATCFYVEVVDSPTATLELLSNAYGYEEANVRLSPGEQVAATAEHPRQVVLASDDRYPLDETGCPLPFDEVTDPGVRRRYAAAQVEDGLAREGSIGLEQRLQYLRVREDFVVDLLREHADQLDDPVRLWIDEPEQRESLRRELERRRLLERADPEQTDRLLNLLREDETLPRLPAEAERNHEAWRRFEDAVRERHGSEVDGPQLRRSLERLREAQGERSLRGSSPDG